MCQSSLRRASFSFSLAICGLMLTVASAPAAVVLDYDLSGLPNEVIPSVTASSVAAGITATELTRGPGLGPRNLTRGFSSNDWATTTASRQNAIDTDQYYQFGFTVQPGGSVSLDQLEVALRRSAVAAPMNYEWQYSLDGFATAGNTISVAGSPYYSGGAFTYLGRSSGSGGVADNYNYMSTSVSDQSAGNPMPPLDLTAITAFQSITAGSSVTFRLYAWGDGGGAATNTVALGRDLGPRLTGSAVPEPAGLVLAGGGLLAGLGGWIRRRSRCTPAAGTI